MKIAWLGVDNFCHWGVNVCARALSSHLRDVDPGSVIADNLQTSRYLAPDPGPHLFGPEIKFLAIPTQPGQLWAWVQLIS